MKQYQPDYYDKFQCISSQCPMTCCMQWRIAVDDETLDQWDDERKKQVKEVEEGHIIELKQDGMCPFLNEQKLCEIVLKDGEGAISHTCHTFPREEHHYTGRIERGLTPGCPAVLDLDELEQKGVLEEEFPRYQKETDIEKIQKAIGANLDMTEERLEEYNLLFLDISAIYRRQNIYGKFLKPLAKEAEGLDCGKTERWSVFRQEMETWQKHLRLLFAEEISSALVTTGTEQVLDMIVKLEWMAMEYAVLWQVLFLQQLQGEITYEKMQESVCVIFRMMGYADEDIWEYMENCFDSVVWPWEYYSMLV